MIITKKHGLETNFLLGFLVTIIYYIHWGWIDFSFSLAAHALKNFVKLDLIQLFRASQQLKSVFYSLTQCDSFWTRAYSSVLLFRSRSCLSNLVAWEGTDPLRLSHLSIFFSLLQLSVLSCLVITIRGSISSLFFTTVLRLIFLASPSVLFFFLFFFQNGRSGVSQNDLVRIKNLKKN